MKRVLIIAHYFSRQEEIGSIRMRGLAKYLPKFGWDPVIVTSKPVEDNCPYYVVDVDYVDELTKWKERFGLNKTLTIKQSFGDYSKDGQGHLDGLTHLLEDLLIYPDIAANWIDPAYYAAEKIIKSQKIDLILSSSFPVSSHLIAEKIKTNYKIPWIADFRDLWTQNHYNDHHKLRRIVESKLEINTIKKADGITTVSQPLAESLALFHDRRDVNTILNGFDDDSWAGGGDNLSTGLTITYTGNLYRGKRDPEVLLSAISNLLANGLIKKSDINLIFFCNDEGWLQKNVVKYGLSDLCKIKGLISRKEALEWQMKSQVLLLLSWNHPSEKGVYTGKLFDYLAAGRPILSIGPEDSVIKNLIEETKTGYHITTTDEAEEIVMLLINEYTRKGRIDYKGEIEYINRYRHSNMAKQFANIFDRIIY